jgi:hypothetical protein
MVSLPTEVHNSLVSFVGDETAANLAGTNRKTLGTMHTVLRSLLGLKQLQAACPKAGAVEGRDLCRRSAQEMADAARPPPSGEEADALEPLPSSPSEQRHDVRCCLPPRTEGTAARWQHEMLRAARRGSESYFHALVTSAPPEAWPLRKRSFLTRAAIEAAERGRLLIAQELLLPEPTREEAADVRKIYETAARKGLVEEVARHMHKVDPKYLWASKEIIGKLVRHPMHNNCDVFFRELTTNKLQALALEAKIHAHDAAHSALIHGNVDLAKKLFKFSHAYTNDPKTLARAYPGTEEDLAFAFVLAPKDAFPEEIRTLAMKAASFSATLTKACTSGQAKKFFEAALQRGGGTLSEMEELLVASAVRGDAVRLRLLHGLFRMCICRPGEAFERTAKELLPLFPEAYEGTKVLFQAVDAGHYDFAGLLVHASEAWTNLDPFMELLQAMTSAPTLPHPGSDANFVGFLRVSLRRHPTALQCLGAPEARTLLTALLQDTGVVAAATGLLQDDKNDEMLPLYVVKALRKRAREGAGAEEVQLQAALARLQTRASEKKDYELASAAAAAS